MFKMLSLAVLTAALVGTGIASAQTTFANINVQEAIDYGQQHGVEPYELRASWLGDSSVVAFYTTPFLRVALASNNAKQKYQPFTVADVTPEMLAPELVVVAGSLPAFTQENQPGNRVANVVTVVVMPKGSKDRSKAIQPTRTTPMDDTYQNLFGFTTTGRGLVAVFPLSVLDENNQVHVVFDDNIKGVVCDDCKASFKLKHVR